MTKTDEEEPFEDWLDRKVKETPGGVEERLRELRNEFTPITRLEPGHILNEALNSENAKKVCPHCGKDFHHWHVEDYDLIWRDGKVVCECGQFIRDYDAG